MEGRLIFISTLKPTTHNVRTGGQDKHLQLNYTEHSLGTVETTHPMSDGDKMSIITDIQTHSEPINTQSVIPIRYYTNTNTEGASPSFTVEKTTEYTMIQDAAEIVPSEEERNSGLDMPLGYSLKFNKFISLINDKGFSTEAACYDLWHDGDLIQTIYVDWDYLYNQVVLFEEASQYIAKLESPEAVEWMRKKVCSNSPSDIPPWERSEPLKDRYLPSITTADTINWSTETINEQYFSMTDDANAHRFTDEIKDWMIYTPSKDKYATSGDNWSVWMGNRYEPAKEKLGVVLRLTGKKPLQVYNKWKDVAEGLENDNPLSKPAQKLVKGLLEFSRSSQGQTAQKNTLAMVEKSTRPIDLNSETNYNILAFKNGAIDTSTGKTYNLWECEQLKKEFPTVYIDCTYHPGYKSQKWINSLIKTFSDNTTDEYYQTTLYDKFDRGDEAIKAAMCFRRYLSYGLLAGNPERKIVFLYGEGANGKSTIANVIENIFGEQCGEVPIKELYVTKDDKAKGSLADALPKRIALIKEASTDIDSTTRRSTLLSSSDIKKFTGEQYTNGARDMRQKGVKTKVNCLIICMTNNLPKMDNVDIAINNRVEIIPCMHRFEGKEANNSISEELIAERDLIFSDMIDQLRAYHGLVEGEHPGLLPLPPRYSALAQDINIDYPYSEFVKLYVRTDKDTKRETISRKTLFDEYLAFIEKEDLEPETRLSWKKFTDTENRVIVARDISLPQATRTAILAAFVKAGFKESRSGNTRGIYARRK